MSGRYQSTASVDGISRFFSYISMIDYSLILIVGVTTADFMAAFEERKLAYYSSAVTLSLLSFWFSVLLSWLLCRQYKTAQKISIHVRG